MTDQPDSFKSVFRHHPAGVALITAVTDAGPVGLTASSVASVSADPPALSFSVTRATGSAGAILRADIVTVHLLTDRHADIARSFARSGGPRFTPGQGWRFLDTGEPTLAAAHATLRCRPVQIVPVGDSSLVVAEVTDVHLGDGAPALLYYDRRFLAVPADSPQL